MSPDENDTQEQELHEMLAEALATEANDQALQAEERLKHALSFAQTTFGPNSYYVAAVLFHMAAFYRSQDKPYSARFHWEEMCRIMRW